MYKIASEFADNRQHFYATKKRKLGQGQSSQAIDSIIELLLMVSMVLLKWMEHYGPYVQPDINTSFIASIRKKRPHLASGGILDQHKHQKRND